MHEEFNMAIKISNANNLFVVTPSLLVVSLDDDQEIIVSDIAFPDDNIESTIDGIRESVNYPKVPLLGNPMKGKTLILTNSFPRHNSRRWQ